MVKRLRYLFMAVVFVALLAGFVAPVSAQAKKQPQRELTQEEKKARLDQLLREKEKRDKAQAQQMDKERPSGKSLAELIAPYEKILDGCRADPTRNKDRCAEAMYELGKFYYDQARDDYIEASERYSKELERFESTGRGSRPVPPIPNYSKSLAMYWQLTREHPNYRNLPVAYVRMGTIYLVGGHVDTARVVWKVLVDRFPKSPHFSTAHFNLGDLAFMDNNYSAAYQHYKQVRRDQATPTQWEMTHFRRGECANSLGDFDEAVDEFFKYVEECDKGTFTRKEYREQALEYMASAFADMENGVQAATKFFAKNKKPYEAQVIYNIGAKNRDRGQWDAAILALEGALKRFPLYKDAPIARQRLIECYVVKKDPKANEERERLVDDYGTGSKWHQANANERVNIDLAKTAVRRALGDVALYYHGQAQKTKNQQMYQTAMKRYNEFFQKFPDDKWRVFEYKYNVAEIYQSMGDCEKAAENYNYVAMQDLSTYPPYVSDVDTLGMDPEELEKLRSQAGSKQNPIAISQEDAGYNTIFALETCRKKDMAREGVSEEKSYALPATKKLIEHCMNFQKRFPNSPNAPEVINMAGDIHFGGKAYNEAIAAYRQVIDQYPNSKVASNATRRLGASYLNSNQFDLASQTFDNLLRKTQRDTKDYAEILELAAGAIYVSAEHQKKNGNLNGAADLFKSIATRFPEADFAAKGWYQAGLCYEEMQDFPKAAATFEDLAQRQSAVREDAFRAAAENYKKANQWDKAAQVYLNAANQIPKAEFAIPSLSSAAAAYEKLGDLNMAGQMFNEIFQRYPNDPKTPLALYNAGLTFEKGQHYHHAIEAYLKLASNYPSDEYASEAYFSVGLCYEKLGEFGKMANSFSDYANKYPGNRFKQVQALVKAGDAYFNMQNFKDAKDNYDKAIKIYEVHAKTADIDVANVAQAYFKLGEILYKEFDAIKYDGKDAKTVAARQKEKRGKLSGPTNMFLNAVKLGVEEWTMRANYMIGRVLYDLAQAEANQTLFGNEVKKLMDKISLLQQLPQFYDRAQLQFAQNITWAKEQNLTGVYIDSSMVALMEMAYQKAADQEEIGQILLKAPTPYKQGTEEYEIYMVEIEGQKMEFDANAMELYEGAMNMAKNLGLPDNEWIQKIRERLRHLNPESEMVDAQWVVWKPEVKKDAEGNVIVTRRDPDYNRNMGRIKNIVDMNISVDDKINQLNRIREEARRNIILEQGKIESLKGGSGS